MFFNSGLIASSLHHKACPPTSPNNSVYCTSELLVLSPDSASHSGNCSSSTESIDPDNNSGNEENVKHTKVKINVAGDIFVTYISTLERFPDTLLGDKKRRQKHYNSEKEMYIFNRNRVMFEWILFYYQSHGDLYIPKTMPVDLIERELLFFGILPGNGNTSKRSSPQKTANIPTPIPDEETIPWREQLFKIVSVPYSSRPSTVWAILDVTLILTSIIAFTIETEPDFENMMTLLSQNGSDVAHVLFYIDAVCVSFFSLDLIIKFLTWPDRINFFKELLNWCDMISVGPFYIQLITFMFNGDVHLPSLFILRMGRVVRLFKLVRRIPALTMVINIISSSRRELAMLAVLWCIFVYISAALMFFLENMNNDSDMFQTMFHSLWWSVVTMGTVGYGDIYPREASGKVAGVFVVFGSTIFLTLPMTVIVSKFNDVYDDIKDQEDLNNRDFTEMPLREKISLIQNRDSEL